MKKYFVSMALLLPVLLHAQTLMPFTVKGKVGNYSAPYRAYLSYTSVEGWTTDSVTLVDGSFSFEGKVRTPRKAMLAINANRNGFNARKDAYEEICLEDVPVFIESPDSLSHMKVKGGQVNADLDVLKGLQKADVNKMEDIGREWMAASAETRKTAAFRERIEKKEAPVREELMKTTIEFIKDHPNSWVSLLSIYQYQLGGADLGPFAAGFNALSAELRSSTMGKYVAEKIESSDKTAIGKPAPDFTLPGVSGKKVSLHDLRGKYVLVDFWASWCVPCRAENPNVVKAYQVYKGKGFEVVGVSLDDTAGKKKWVDAIKKDGLAWTQLSDLKGWLSPVVVAYGVGGIPANFLIGPDGTIVAKGLRGDALANKLKELLP